MWEYFHLNIYEVFDGQANANVNNILDKLGAAGWELVSAQREVGNGTICHVCYFKRKKTKDGSTTK